MTASIDVFSLRAEALKALEELARLVPEGPHDKLSRADEARRETHITNLGVIARLLAPIAIEVGEATPDGIAPGTYV
jgi:hypothetical protein